MFSGLSRHSGMRVNSALSTASTISSGRIVGIDRQHLGAVDHDVGHRQFAQVEQAAHHVAVELLDAALAVQQVDGAAHLLVRREDRLFLADADADKPQDPAHQPLDRRSAPGRAAGPPAHRPRDQQRHAVGRVEGDGLRQHLGEHHDQHRHHDRGVDARRRRRTRPATRWSPATRPGY